MSSVGEEVGMVVEVVGGGRGAGERAGDGCDVAVVVAPGRWWRLGRVRAVKPARGVGERMGIRSVDQLVRVVGAFIIPGLIFMLGFVGYLFILGLNRLGFDF